MANKLSIYVLRQPGTAGAPSLVEVFSGDSGIALKQEYTAMAAGFVTDCPFLCAYTKEGGVADIYRLYDGNPWIHYATTIRLETGWDLVETFTLGNQQHLMFYQRSSGTFNIFQLNERLESTSQFQYKRTHDPGVTQDFTTVKAFTNRGRVFIFGYDLDSGRVAIYGISVVATSPPGIAPIMATNTWAYVWAKGWTRFAFFQLGGENFFLNTNTLGPNVSIDHILDDPKEGTSEVATHLENSDQEILSMGIIQPFYLANGVPHFLAYKEDGTTNLYRIGGDCQGWTKLNASNTVRNADRIVPVKIGDSQYFVFN